MKLNASSGTVEANVPGVINDAMIKATPAAFKALSSNLYTDKPRAIVREVCANALDAHKAAGTLDIPFEIHAPTALCSELRIRDYGVGLSHEAILSLYMTYFGTDKNTSNELIGGFGLGSKTPFSYTDTFSVVSRFNGVKSTYSAFVQDNGTPGIVLLNAEDTDEHNGLEVIVPVHTNDIYEFQRRAGQVLQYFPEGSFTATNINVEPLSYKIRNARFGLRYNGANNNHVVMGPVAYELDWFKLPDKLYNEYRDIRRFFGQFDIFAEVGEVDVQVSREGLSYDKHSIARLRALLEDVRIQAGQTAIDEINAQSTLAQRWYKARELYGTFQLDSNFHALYTSTRDQFEKDLHAKIPDIATDVVIRWQDRRRKRIDYPSRR